jgi:hypothetical protein
VVVPELEEAVVRLGDETWRRDPDWSLSQLSEFYDGGAEALGPLGPTAPELLEAQLWFLMDCPLPSGETPLWRARRERSGRAVELLARSELRAWRIEAVDGPRQISAECPLGTGRARLELCRDPAGAGSAGAVIVARSVPVGPERWALLGGAPIVDRDSAPAFERLLASLDAPRGDFWRVHGGMLVRASWTWPGSGSAGAAVRPRMAAGG